MTPIHPLSVPVPSPALRNPVCRPPSGSKGRRRGRRRARARCRLSAEVRAGFKKQYYRSACAFASRYGLHNPEAVADAALDEALRAFRRRDGQFKALLFTILRWRSISAYRQQSRQSRLQQSSQSRRPISVPCQHLSKGIDVAVEWAGIPEEFLEVESLFCAAWRTLSEVERQLLKLHYIQGQTFPEIQKSKLFRHQRWAEATLRSKAYRACLKLRSRLQSILGTPEKFLLHAVRSLPLN